MTKMERMTSMYGQKKPPVKETGIPGVDYYQIRVPIKYLELTSQKFLLARLPHDFEQPEGKEWDDGTPKNVVEDLIDYWNDHYSWHKQEAALNQLPHFKTSIAPAEGHSPLRVHFVWKKSTRPNAVPLMLVHGWPSSFYEFIKVVDKLTEPEEEGAQAFHVVLPSLPGYAFSDPPNKPGIGVIEFAKMFHELMNRIGYQNYLLHGGDWGSLVVRSMALQFPRNVCAFHCTFFPCAPPNPFKHPILALRLASGLITGGKIGLSAKDLQNLKEFRQFRDDETGYQWIQGTKPQSIAYGLTDSPVGLLAWIREKMETWTDNYQWQNDEVLTWFMMHWLPGPYSGMRLYKESGQVSSKTATLINAKGTVPLGISFYKGEIAKFPLEWAATLFPLKWHREHNQGGHFAAFERPTEFVQDLRDFFSLIIPSDARLRTAPVGTTAAEGSPDRKGKGKAPAEINTAAVPSSNATAASPTAPSSRPAASQQPSSEGKVTTSVAVAAPATAAGATTGSPNTGNGGLPASPAAAAPPNNAVPVSPKNETGPAPV